MSKRPFLTVWLSAAVLAAAACSPISVPVQPAGPATATPSPQPADDVVSATPGGPDSADAAPTPPYAPQAGDAALVRDQVYLDKNDLLSAESFPPQITLSLAGSLPTPCHRLRLVVAPPDAQNRIMIDAYSVTDPNKICVQVLQAFEQSVPLGSFPAGAYTVWINGKQVGEFKS